MKLISFFGLLGILSFAAINQKTLAEEPKVASPSEATNDVAGDKAWKELEKASQTPPIPPEAWSSRQPTDEEREKFRALQRDVTGTIADKAKDFYTRFPKHPKASEAQAKEREFLGFATQLGNTNLVTRLEALEAERLKDPNLSEDEKFEMRIKAVHQAAQKKRPEGMEALFAEYEKGARALQKDFPKQSGGYELMLSVASNVLLLPTASYNPDDKAKMLANEIVNGSAPDEVKTSAKALLKKLDAVGKPLAIQFKAIDGREVDLAKMKGKVVLVDFWATWCGVCLAELPNIKAVYEKLHPKGFEIIGINLDYTKESLEHFMAEEKLPWTQYYDSESGQSKFAREFDIQVLPVVWLVDKKGILRDLRARGEDLEKKVEALLAE